MPGSAGEMPTLGANGTVLPEELTLGPTCSVCEIPSSRYLKLHINYAIRFDLSQRNNGNFVLNTRHLGQTSSYGVILYILITEN